MPDSGNTSQGNSLLEIPGDYLEGGGQILRTALSLSVITQRPVRIFNIRAKREKPGLKAQHFHTIQALKEISDAKLEGFSLGSSEIKFLPSKVKSRNLDIDIKTAGSIGLLLQSLILAGCFSPSGITADIKGGTCGKGAIPVEYYLGVIIPILRHIGIEVKLDLIKRGYYPKGGGEVKIRIEPKTDFMPLTLTEQGRLTKIEGISHANRNLEKQRVAERQKDKAEKILKKRFDYPVEISAEYSHTLSLGSGISVWAKTDTGAILGADSLGERGKTSERVAEEAVDKLTTEINSGAAADTHLSDNLIPYLALCGGKIKTALPISLHTQTNIWVCEQFFGKIFKVEKEFISVEKGVYSTRSTN